MNLRKSSRPTGCLVALMAAVLCFCPGPGMAVGPEDLARWEQLTTDSVKALRANQLPDAVRLCNQAIMLAATFGPTNTQLARSEVLRAEIYLWESQYGLAEQTFQNAVAACEKAAGSNSLELIYPLSSQANFYYFVVPHLDRVASLFERILRIVENAPAPDQRDVIMWSRNLGKIYQETKNYRRAEPLFKRAVTLCEQHDAEWLPYELLTCADFYRDWGKYGRAETLARRALTIREQALPAGGVDAQIEVTVCLANLGATALAAHKPKEAESTFRRSLGLLEKAMPADEPELVPHLVGLADALQAQRKFEEAGKLYQRTLEIARKNQIENSREMAAIHEKYAALLQNTNQPEEAKKQWEQAKAIHQLLDAKATKNSGVAP